MTSVNLRNDDFTGFEFLQNDFFKKISEMGKQRSNTNAIAPSQSPINRGKSDPQVRCHAYNNSYI